VFDSNRSVLLVFPLARLPDFDENSSGEVEIHVECRTDPAHREGCILDHWLAVVRCIRDQSFGRSWLSEDTNLGSAILGPKSSAVWRVSFRILRDLDFGTFTWVSLVDQEITNQVAAQGFDACRDHNDRPYSLHTMLPIHSIIAAISWFERSALSSLHSRRSMQGWRFAWSIS
jgi:hypothetical protein